MAPSEAGLVRGRSPVVAGGTAGGGARAKLGGGVRCRWGRGAVEWGRGAEARARSRGSCLRAAQPASRGICCVLRTGLTLGFSSDMVARRRRRQAQREPVALERASHALCPAALPPQLSRGRALSLNPGAPVGRAESRGRARARGACPAPRVRAGQPRFRTVANASRGGSGARARAGPRGRATRGPGPRDPPPDVGARLCGYAGSREARENLGARVLSQKAEERFGPTGSHFDTHVWGLFLYTGCIWGREGEETQGCPTNPFRWSRGPVRRLPGMVYGPHTPRTGLWL